jgi:YD repeat-containing protein
VRITQRAASVFAGLAVLALLAGVAPAFASQEPPARPPSQEQARQAQPVQGDLVKVDADMKALTVKTADGTEVQFKYDDSTQITGAKDAAGLATMKEGRVTVHFKEDAQTKAKLATRIIVEPRQ